MLLKDTGLVRVSYVSFLLSPTPHTHTYKHACTLVSVSEWKSLSCVWLFVTLWTIQSMEFSRPQYWSGKLFPSPGDLPNPGIEPRSPHCRRILYQLSHKGSTHTRSIYFLWMKLTQTLNWKERQETEGRLSSSATSCIILGEGKTHP